MATAINIMQSWLDRASSLRADMLQSEVAFFDFLIEGERGSCPWQGQYTSFEQLLGSTNLCAPQRYAAYRDAIARANGQVVSRAGTLGVDGVIEAGRMPESKREEFIERVVEGAKNQGCPLSPRRIKEISQQVSPTTKPTRGPEVERDAKAIVAENKKLHAENKALRARVERLEAENEALKARLKKK